MTLHHSIGRIRDTAAMLMASVVASVVASVMVAAACAVAGAQAPGYAVTKQIPLPGDGGWDYLEFDNVGHRLFITHGTHVIVVDPKTGALLGDIPGTPHVHGVALAPDLGRGFISSAGDTLIHIFDLKTLKPLGTVKADSDDDAMLYDPKTHYAVSMNGDAGSATVIDGATGRVVGTVSLPGKPEFAVSDGRGTIFANLEDKSLLVAIDLATLKVVRQWPLAPCESPSGLAIDAQHHRLFSGCHNKLMAISDADAGKVIATVPIGARVDANRFDPGTGTAFSSNGDGTLTVVHEDGPDKFTEVGTVQTVVGARTMALDPDTHTIYLVTAKFAPVVGNERPKPLPGSFTLLVVERKP
jgi:DNA-binding beta-propeller fold protein YncE